MKNLDGQFPSKASSAKDSSLETQLYVGRKSNSKVPIFKLAFQGILLLLGIGAALQFIWQLLALVPN